ncbi:MAG: AraC family transcriptional regulator [Caulobacteraceae bacterium]|nr:AraC family transcriptional regulator [Caulobacteraceae bacterium]
MSRRQGAAGRRALASGSCIFADIDGFQARFGQTLDLLPVERGSFHARLTRVELPTLRLLRAWEGAPRVARVSLPPEPVFVTFPSEQVSPLVCDGVELRFGDIMFHSLGERLYQRTSAACHWGWISLTPEALASLSGTVAGEDLAAPPAGRIVRPLPKDGLALVRLHAQACRIAETHLDRIGHKEVARALDQDLIWALITCLAEGKTLDDPMARRHRSELMARFEAALTARHHRLLRTPDACRALGVSEQTLRTACAHVLGMSPSRYQRLRRLKLVRQELLRASPVAGGSAEVVGRYGFADLGRFVAEYRNAYGERPPGVRRGATDR